MSVRCFPAARAGVVSLLAVAVVSLIVTGCGPDEPFTHAKIHGKITYEDGTPIDAPIVRVIFEPQAEPVDQKTHPRPGEVRLEPDGSFKDVTSHKYGDGVVLGKHTVVIIPMDEEERPTNAVPKKYQSVQTSDLVIDTADFSDDKPYHIKVPKK